MNANELRAIDSRIAGTIMKLRPCLLWKHINLGSAGGPALMHFDNNHDYKCYPDIGGSDLSGPPKYSVNPAASKSLREKLVADGFSWRLEYDSESSGPWFVATIQKDHAWFVKETTEELAVALCALKAYEAQR